MRNRANAAAVVLFALALSCWPVTAQEIHYRLIPHRSLTSAELQAVNHPPAPLAIAANTLPYRPSALFQVGESEISGGTYDPAADQVLRSAEAATKALIHVPTLTFQRAATRRDEYGDVVVVEWAIHEPYGAGSIVLEDTPFESIYEIKLRDFEQLSQTRLSDLLSAALVWRQATPNYIDSMTVDIPEGPLIDSFRVDWPLRRAIIIGLREGMEGEIDQGDLFIHFQLDKGPFGKFYPVPSFVPERFPPLTNLIETWSFAQIRREVGRSVRAYPKGHDFSSARDRILLATLARRGLTQDQVVDLLDDVDHTADGYHDRFVAVMAGFEASNTAFLSPFFDPILDNYKEIGTSTRLAVQALFGAATRQCSASYEDRALGLLRRGLFPEGPLAYVGLCSRSIATVSALEAMVLAHQRT